MELNKKDRYNPLSLVFYIYQVYNHIEKIPKYIVKVSNYVERFGGSGAYFAEMAIPVLLNADDVCGLLPHWRD